ncbi:acyl-CoA dehydrogenase family protein [Methylobacterium sp. P31]
MNALIRDAVAAMSDAETPASFSLVATTRAKRLKIVCSEMVDEICQGALGLIGLPGYSEQGAISVATAVRDALSAQILVSNHRLISANAEVERYVEENL